MLFSQTKVFHKKQRPIPATLGISAPLSRKPFNETSSPATSPSYRKPKSQRTMSNEPAVPAPVYATKRLEEPSLLATDVRPAWDDQWFSSTSRSRSSSSSSMQKASPQHPQRRPGFLSRHNWSKLFRNAGLDENGQLKPEFREVDSVDWGVPDEWLPREQQSRHR